MSSLQTLLQAITQVPALPALDTGETDNLSSSLAAAAAVAVAAAAAAAKSDRTAISSTAQSLSWVLLLQAVLHAVDLPHVSPTRCYALICCPYRGR